MPKILLVKTSSLGDVIHALPAVSDVHARFPDASVDWVVEAPFAAIPALHRGVGRVIPVAVRRWRGRLLQHETWREMRAFAAGLRAQRYDAVIDLQGLVKSALIVRMAQGPRMGYDRRSAREPVAALAYDRTYPVPRTLHAVERNRQLTGHCLGYTPAGEPDYGLYPSPHDLPWLAAPRYAVLLHSTSRDDKLWPEADWIALGRWLQTCGLVCVLPWGSAREQARAQRLAAQLGTAVRVAPPLPLDALAALCAGAALTVGVDTGLTHLAAAVGCPTLALFCRSDPGLTGVYAGAHALNLGDAGAPPSFEAVRQAAQDRMR